MFSLFKKNKKGLTLIEVALSLLIFGITVAALVGTFTIGRLMTVSVKHRAKAMNLLRARMEWVKTQTYAYLEERIDDPLSPENNVDNSVGTDELLNDTRTTSVVKDANGNLIVTVTLNWTKQGVGKSIQKGTAGSPDERLVTLISPD